MGMKKIWDAMHAGNISQLIASDRELVYSSFNTTYCNRDTTAKPPFVYNEKVFTPLFLLSRVVCFWFFLFAKLLALPHTRSRQIKRVPIDAHCAQRGDGSNTRRNVLQLIASKCELVK